jgi:hypothetical protein
MLSIFYQNLAEQRTLCGGLKVIQPFTSRDLLSYQPGPPESYTFGQYCLLYKTACTEFYVATEY